VVGFPIFTSVALHHLSSAHSSVIVGLLPAATAAMAVARAGERPAPAFWLAATAGLIAVLAFAATQGVNGIETADVLVLIAVALAALGYAEGGALSRTYGGWQVICWALVFSAPFLVIPVTVAASHGVHAGADAWLGFAYVSVISMFLGFFAWYHGLALGGVARIGQIQLAQPVMTLLWSALILGETVTHGMLIAAFAVLACVVATQRTRSAQHERGRRGALDAHGDVEQRAALPGGADQAEDDDVVDPVAVPVPRGQHALAPEPDPFQRPL
jgi:drug/metabolite transporter (DMT)-like permease